jgi:hypothetical protein
MEVCILSNFLANGFLLKAQCYFLMGTFLQLFTKAFFLHFHLNRFLLIGFVKTFSRYMP